MHCSFQRVGGGVSDKHVTENCGILSKLLLGDQILADHDFTVQESVGLSSAKITIPPFTRGKNLQLYMETMFWEELDLKLMLLA